MKRLWRIAAVVVLLGMMSFSITSPVYGYAPPISLTISQIEAYRNALELNDILVIVSYDIDYAVPTSVPPINEAYLGRFMNGATELKAVTPYPYKDYGYAPGIFSIYFSAAEVTALGITWGGVYTIELRGNPSLVWVPSVPQTASSTFALWYDGGTITSTMDRLTIRLRSVATTLGTTWANALTEQIGGVTKLNDDGEDYFTNAITNLRSMCPDLFSDAFINAEFGDKAYVQDLYASGDDTPRNAHGVNWLGQTFTASSSYSIAGLSLKLSRTGAAPGTLTVSLRSAGAMAGADLATGTINGNNLNTYALGTWYNVTFTSDYAITAGSSYAIIIRATTGGVANYVSWETDTAGSYTTGGFFTSGDSGATWNAVAGSDAMFAVVARDAFSQNYASILEARLLGTQFDMTNLGNAFHIPRMWMSSLVWFAVCIGMAIMITRVSQSYKPSLLVVFILMPIGIIVGFLPMVVGIVAALLSGTAVIYVFFFRGAA